ncbi:MAG: hypothetical protein ACJATT_004478, partial [Myxococcota bacterium]
SLRTRFHGHHLQPRCRRTHRAVPRPITRQCGDGSTASPRHHNAPDRALVPTRRRCCRRVGMASPAVCRGAEAWSPLHRRQASSGRPFGPPPSGASASRWQQEAGLRLHYALVAFRRKWQAIPSIGEDCLQLRHRGDFARAGDALSLVSFRLSHRLAPCIEIATD